MNWIDIAQGLPPTGEVVFVLLQNGRATVAAWTGDEWIRLYDSPYWDRQEWTYNEWVNFGLAPTAPTHWHRLPDPRDATK